MNFLNICEADNLQQNHSISERFHYNLAMFKWQLKFLAGSYTKQGAVILFIFVWDFQKVKNYFIGMYWMVVCDGWIGSKLGLGMV